MPTLQDLADLPWSGYLEPSRLVQISGYPFEHEVRVWLPPSYRHSAARTYPVLWLTDNALETGRVCSHGSELIVVSIGSPQGTPIGEFQRRRTYDFLPASELLDQHFADIDGASVGGAPAFRDFLVDTLRPELMSEYRMAVDDHGYAGGSGGAMFGLFVLLTRPDSFAKYVLASPAAGVDFLRLEQECAARYGDVAARVLLGAGADEMSDPMMARAGIVSTVARVVEALTARGYRSLELTATILPGENHSTAYRRLLSDGVRLLWPQAEVSLAPQEEPAFAPTR